MANAAGYTYNYSYDTAGNITSIKSTPTSGTATTKTLTYGDSVWKDRLTKVQVGSTSENITYETAANGYISGNPVSYFNGQHYNFTWQKGRQLATAKVGGVTTSYTYDMSGVRSGKTVDGTEYKFDTLNGLVMRQTWGNQSLYFLYDETNQPYGFAYLSSASAAPVFYYYVLNQQGDVVALMNSSLEIVARYRYDPWGAVTVDTDSSGCKIGTLNPLRYRGYYYDGETGLYYLQSRYYDPAIGRFINADTFATTDAQGFLSCNMFAYCENDPVNRRDLSGADWREVFAVGITIAVVGLAILTAIPTGGGSLAFAGVSISAASASLAANATIGAGITLATGSFLFSQSGQSSEQKSGSTKLGNDKRIDYEYNGNGTGNVHIHTGKGPANKHILWTFNNGVEQTMNVSKTVGRIIQVSKIAKVITKYQGIIKSLAGFLK